MNIRKKNRIKNQQMKIIKIKKINRLNNKMDNKYIYKLIRAFIEFKSQ